MIPQTPTQITQADWQKELSKAISNPAELLSQLGLSNKIPSLDKDKLKQFPLRVTQSYINKMRYADATDPLLRQVFPLIDEGVEAEGYTSDPVGDQFAVKSPGVLQKYQGRALLVTTGACAIHCRYCFRRHYPYGESNPLASQWQQTLTSLNDNKDINEVILSGGDPLSLTDTKLNTLIQNLEAIPHIKRLRIHTRLPLVLPARITHQLIATLNNCRFNVVMVIHANHANEIDDDVAQSIAALKQSGCELLNQTVLLQGINDDVESLVNLSEALSDIGVMPYYLHLLDRVQGAQHFDVAEEKGIELINSIRKKLPGYLVPRLVREQQGEASKTIIR
jgi:EF-P beta-lysylation protein EpmB